MHIVRRKQEKQKELEKKNKAAVSVKQRLYSFYLDVALALANTFLSCVVSAFLYCNFFFNEISVLKAFDHFYN